MEKTGNCGHKRPEVRQFVDREDKHEYPVRYIRTAYDTSDVRIRPVSSRARNQVRVI